MTRGEIERRLNPSTYKEQFKFISTRFKNIKLGQIAFIDPRTSFTHLKKDDVISFFPMESVSDVNGVIFRHNTKRVFESKGFTRFKVGDLIWAKISPCMQNGKSAVLYKATNGFACGSTEYYVIRTKNETVLIEYLHFLLRDKRVLQSAQNFFGGSAGQQRVGKDYLLNFNVPLPPLDIQKVIIAKLKKAFLDKKQKEIQSKELLNSFESYILEEFGITIPKLEFVEQLFVNVQQLENALNVERYAVSFDKSTLKWTTVDMIGVVELSTLTPSSDLYKYNDFTLLRIDDLPNKPQKAKSRFVKGSQIAGSVQLVKENDVLIARLEPTIVNKKIISAPYSETDILASSEFIRLTCNKKNNPLFVKYILQTDFYTQLMRSKTRGATPSRRRLSRVDFEHLPFPVIDKVIQDEIAFEYEKRISKALKLNKDAKLNYQKTKDEVENLILKAD